MIFHFSFVIHLLNSLSLRERVGERAYGLARHQPLFPRPSPRERRGCRSMTNEK
jgi:hypothetical protein